MVSEEITLAHVWEHIKNIWVESSPDHEISRWARLWNEQIGGQSRISAPRRNFAMPAASTVIPAEPADLMRAVERAEAEGERVIATRDGNAEAAVRSIAEAEALEPWKTCGAPTRCVRRWQPTCARGSPRQLWKR